MSMTTRRGASLEQLNSELRSIRGLLEQMFKLLASSRVEPPQFDDDEFETLSVPPVEDEAMSVAEAAEALGIGPEQTRRLLRAGTLAGVPLGGRRGWLVSRASVGRLSRERSVLNAGRRELTRV